MNTGVRHQIMPYILFAFAVTGYGSVLFAEDLRPLRVVYDVAVDSPEALNNVLARASHMSKMTGADPLEGSIVLVLHGNEVVFFNKDDHETYRNIVDRARSLSVGAVIKIKISELALKVRGLGADDVHSFLEVVPFGDAEIARLQAQEEHVYLQAHNLAP